MKNGLSVKINIKKNTNKLVYDIKPIRSFREMLENSADEYAERTAILFTGKDKNVIKKTYGDLLNDVRDLSAYLNLIGLEGKKIAVIGRNSYQWMLTYLAVACGVGVIVPVDKELKSEDVGNILRTAEASALVYSGETSETVKASGFMGIMLEAELFDDYLAKGHAAREAGDMSYENHRVDPDGLGILLFTSGTTGMAKGVMLSQYNICSNITAVRRRVMIYPDDRSLSVLPLHHTYECMAGFLSFLSAGASIAISDGLRTFVKELQIYKPTVFVTVPLLLESLHSKLLKKYASVRGGKFILNSGRVLSNAASALNLDLGSSIFRQIHDFFGGRMTRILVGAAPLSPQIFRDFESFGFKVYCGYGLTETSPVCIMHDDFNRSADHIGRPICGVRVKLFKTEAEDLTGLHGRSRQADVGEIAVKGPNVMLGYYKDSEATAAVIEDGWFHTGDLAVCDADGNYRIVGRIKNVIVTQNGKKIFPEEIEYRLNKSRFIKESLVCGVSDGAGDVIVTARILPNFEEFDAHFAKDGIKPGTPEYEDKMRKILLFEIEQVNKHFANYKAIRRFSIRREEFVKTTSRKIKRGLEENHREE
jgi:long-chain acyl-CoA synthetase